MNSHGFDKDGGYPYCEASGGVGAAARVADAYLSGLSNMLILKVHPRQVEVLQVVVLLGVVHLEEVRQVEALRAAVLQEEVRQVVL